MTKYNTSNLTPFTSNNASYYGSLGGKKSGKIRLAKSINKIHIQLQMYYYDLNIYKNRKRLYNNEINYIKHLIHKIKILKNKLNKLIDKYDKKYSIKA